MGYREKILLRTVYHWECPNCGHENLEEPDPDEVTPEEEQEIREQLNIEDDEIISMESVIYDVVCIKCNREYEVMQPEDLEYE